MRRMNSGIGSSGTDHRERFTGNLAQRSLQRILDSRAARLTLPAVKRGAAILDAEGDPLDRHLFTPAQSGNTRSRERQGR